MRITMTGTEQEIDRRIQESVDRGNKLIKRGVLTNEHATNKYYHKGKLQMATERGYGGNKHYAVMEVYKR